MAVERIETYGDTLKVILKPTDKFPVGYFYCDSDDKTLNLVNSYSWHLSQQGKRTCVEVNLWGSKLYFHREYAYNILNKYPACIDHINGIELDNTDNNLNPVTNQQNNYNKPTRGYIFDARRLTFRPQIQFNDKVQYPYGVVHSEEEACILQRKLETDYLESLTGKDDYYMYDFLLDRRNNLDILDLERTKQISAEEATYRHVMKYVDNAWYYYRYNLESYFRYYHIPVPQYAIKVNPFVKTLFTKN